MAAALVLLGCISLAYTLPTTPHVAAYVKPNMKTSTMTTHRAEPYAWTLLEAYREPMIIMQLVNPTPPTMTDVLLPQRSAKRNAGTEIARMRMPDKPEAKKEASWFERPAWAKSVGAY